MEFVLSPWLFVIFGLGFFVSGWNAYRLAHKTDQTERVVASIASLTAIVCMVGMAVSIGIAAILGKLQ